MFVAFVLMDVGEVQKNLESVMFPSPRLHCTGHSLRNFSSDVVNRHIGSIGNLYQHVLRASRCWQSTRQILSPYFANFAIPSHFKVLLDICFIF